MTTFKNNLQNNQVGDAGVVCPEINAGGTSGRRQLQQLFLS
jgi:hypothetical protein